MIIRDTRVVLKTCDEFKTYFRYTPIEKTIDRTKSPSGLSRDNEVEFGQTFMGDVKVSFQSRRLSTCTKKTVTIQWGNMGFANSLIWSTHEKRCRKAFRLFALRRWYSKVSFRTWKNKKKINHEDEINKTFYLRGSKRLLISVSHGRCLIPIVSIVVISSLDEFSTEVTAPTGEKIGPGWRGL